MVAGRTLSESQVLPCIGVTRAALRCVFIRDLVLECSIGIHAHERTALQRVRINLDLAVTEGETSIDDDIRNVICYERLAEGIQCLASLGHVNLVETFADMIAEMSLHDPRVQTVRVRVEKLDILKNAASVGVEIERSNHPDARFQ
jgi:dihydroneopterin aldolase